MMQHNWRHSFIVVVISIFVFIQFGNVNQSVHADDNLPTPVARPDSRLKTQTALPPKAPQTGQGGGISLTCDGRDLSSDESRRDYAAMIADPARRVESC